MPSNDRKAGDFLKHDMSFAAQTNDVPDGFIAGIASSPTVDCYGHRVMPGAFDASMALFSNESWAGGQLG